MKGSPKGLYATFTILLLVLLIPLLVVTNDGVGQLVCNEYGENLPQFCDQHTPQIAPLNLEVIKATLEAQNPGMVWTATSKQTISADSNTIREVEAIDTSSVSGFLNSGAAWIGNQSHNLTSAEYLQITADFEVPVYVDLSGISITCSVIGNTCTATMPAPTVGRPALVEGSIRTSVESGVLSGRDVDREALINDIIDGMLGMASKKANNDVITKREAVCSAYNSTAQAIQSTYSQANTAGKTFTIITPDDYPCQ